MRGVGERARRMLAKVLGEHGLWARLTGHLERWTRRGGRR